MRTFLILFLLLFHVACETPSDMEENSARSATIDSTITIRRSWYPSGRIHAEVDMMGNLQHGLFEEYHENGSIKATQEWEYGEAVGEFKIYDENGVMIYHTSSEYVEYPEGELKVYHFLVHDSSQTFTTDDRVLLFEEENVNYLLTVEPKQIKFGQKNVISIDLLNLSIHQARVSNGSIRISPEPNTYEIQAKDPSKNVMLYVSSRANGELIEFDPVELIVE